MNLLRLITPTNIAQEREKFFQSSSYNPAFKYNWPSQSDDKFIQSILDQDRSLITTLALETFQVDLEESVNEAKSALINRSFDLPVETISEIKSAFENAFSFFGLNYQLELVDKYGFNFRPEPKNAKVVMSKHANLQFFDAEGEVKHEMVHILRYENSKFNKIEKSETYLPTEEGLASYMQDNSINGSASRFQHAAEYMASGVGIHGSLRDIFDYFISIGFNSELAWQRAIRHKFGFTDTSKPGDIIKPAMYFYNSIKIGKLARKDLLKLFIGKISISDLTEHSDYRGKFSVEKLRKFYGIDF
jgi:hypothetical protein